MISDSPIYTPLPSPHHKSIQIPSPVDSATQNSNDSIIRSKNSDITMNPATSSKQKQYLYPDSSADTDSDENDNNINDTTMEDDSISINVVAALRAENNELRLRLGECEEQLMVAAQVGQSLLGDYEKLRSRLKEVEGGGSDVDSAPVRASTSFEQLRDLEMEFESVESSLKGFVGKLSRSNSPEMPRSNKKLARKNSNKSQQSISWSPRKLSIKFSKPQSPRKKKQPTHFLDPDLASDIDNQLIHQVRSLRHEVGMLNEDKFEMQEKITALEGQLDSLRKVYEKACMAGSKQDERLWELEFQNQQFLDRATAAETELSRLTQHTRHLESAYNEALDQIESFRNTEHQKTATYDLNRSRLESELSRSRRTILQLESQNSELVQTCSELTNQLERSTFYNRDNTSSPRSIRTCPHDLDLDDRASSPSPSSIHHSSPDKSPSKNKTSFFVESLSASLEHAHERIEGLENLNEGLRRERVELIKMLAEAQETIESLRAAGTVVNGELRGRIMSGGSSTEIEDGHAPTVMDVDVSKPRRVGRNLLKEFKAVAAVAAEDTEVDTNSMVTLEGVENGGDGNASESEPAAVNTLPPDVDATSSEKISVTKSSSPEEPSQAESASLDKPTIKDTIPSEKARLNETKPVALSTQPPPKSEIGDLKGKTGFIPQCGEMIEINEGRIVQNVRGIAQAVEPDMLEIGGRVEKDGVEGDGRSSLENLRIQTATQTESEKQRLRRSRLPLPISPQSQAQPNILTKSSNKIILSLDSSTFDFGVGSELVMSVDCFVQTAGDERDEEVGRPGVVVIKQRAKNNFGKIKDHDGNQAVSDKLHVECGTSMDSLESLDVIPTSTLRTSHSESFLAADITPPPAASKHERAVSVPLPTPPRYRWSSNSQKQKENERDKKDMKKWGPTPYVKASPMPWPMPPPREEWKKEKKEVKREEKEKSLRKETGDISGLVVSTEKDNETNSNDAPTKMDDINISGPDDTTENNDHSIKATESEDNIETKSNDAPVELNDVNVSKPDETIEDDANVVKATDITQREKEQATETQTEIEKEVESVTATGKEDKERHTESFFATICTTPVPAPPTELDPSVSTEALRSSVLSVKMVELPRPEPSTNVSFRDSDDGDDKKRGKDEENPFMASLLESMVDNINTNTPTASTTTRKRPLAHRRSTLYKSLRSHTAKSRNQTEDSTSVFETLLKNASSMQSLRSFATSSVGSEKDKERDKDIESLTYTMIGSWFQKFNRHNRSPRLRYFWINPYSRTLNWAAKPPSQGKKSMQTKTAFIVSISYSQPPPSTKTHNYPPGASHALTIQTPQRVIKMVPTSWVDYEKWIIGLKLLLDRMGRRGFGERFRVVQKDESDDEENSDEVKHGEEQGEMTLEELGGGGEPSQEGEEKVIGRRNSLWSSMQSFRRASIFGGGGDSPIRLPSQSLHGESSTAPQPQPQPQLQARRRPSFGDVLRVRKSLSSSLSLKSTTRSRSPSTSSRVQIPE